ISEYIPDNALLYIFGLSGFSRSAFMLESFAESYSENIMEGQSSIVISRCSKLATYMGIMDDIRSIFSRSTGQPAGLFSFNSLGACPVCKGKGVTTQDVAFADPVTILCDACVGTRYSDEDLT